MVKENHYVVATQDRDLQDWIRHQIGIALLYLHNVVPHLDEPSQASKKFVLRKTKASTQVSTFEDERLAQLKKKQGLIQEPRPPKKAKTKKKGGPNPLSCKKKAIPDKLRVSRNKMTVKNKKQCK